MEGEWKFLAFVPRLVFNREFQNYLVRSYQSISLEIFQIKYPSKKYQKLKFKYQIFHLKIKNLPEKSIISTLKIFPQTSKEMNKI